MDRADVAGWLLLGSFVLWFPAAAMPPAVWRAPFPERQALIEGRRRAWRMVNTCIAAAAWLLVLGFAAFAEALDQEGGGVLVALSLATLVLAAPLWLATVIARAAAREPVAWTAGFFLAWSYLANAAVIGFGVAILHSGYPAAWCGWAAIALAGLMLVQLLATGDALPALYHVGPALIGVALLSS